MANYVLRECHLDSDSSSVADIMDRTLDRDQEGERRVDIQRRVSILQRPCNHGADPLEAKAPKVNIHRNKCLVHVKLRGLDVSNMYLSPTRIE